MIIISLVLCFVYSGIAAENKTDTLTKIETSILGADYSNQKTENRLTRLEEYVYGKKKSGSNANRLKALAKDLNADVIGQEITPSPETIAESEEYKEDSSVDYPIIDDVEKNLKITSKPNQSLHSRLVAIEKQLFNNVYDTDDFYTRVERIKGKVYKNSNMLAEYDDDDDFTIPEYSAEDILYGRGPEIPKLGYKSGNKLQNSKLDMLERKILSKTYSDENNNDRLARLENCLFDTEFYYDDESERINRIEGALKGKRTSDRYDNNKLQQRLNTAMQIGAMILMVLACIL